MEWNYRFLFIYFLPALLTPVQLIPFTTEKINIYTIEVAEGANKASSNLPSCFFISCFIVSVTPSTNTPKFSNYFMILIISFISSFEVNTVNFPALTALFPLIHFQIY